MIDTDAATLIECKLVEALNETADTLAGPTLYVLCMVAKNLGSKFDCDIGFVNGRFERV